MHICIMSHIKNIKPYIRNRNNNLTQQIPKHLSLLELKPKNIDREQ